MSTPRVSHKASFLTWAALLFLTLLTSLLGLIDLGRMTIALAITIAAVKASLIAVFFMHALRSSMLVRVAASAAVIWLLLLITLTLADYQTRGWLIPSGH